MINRSRTRQQLADIVLMNLGHPVVRVNITNDQLNNAIDTAMKRIWRWHHDATFDSSYVFEATEEDVARGWVALPDTIESVVEVIHGTNLLGNGSFATPEWQMSAATAMSANRFLPISLVDYVAVQQRILNTRLVLRGNPNFTYVTEQRRLIFKFKVRAGAKYALRTVERVDPEVTDPRGVDSSLFFDNEMLKALATALAKQVWGMNLRKFQGMTIPGGITVDGNVLYEEGKREEGEIMQQLKDESVDMIYIF